MAKASSFALLTDQVAIRKGKKQISGSQIGTNPEISEYFVAPTKDPENINQRRESVGLGNIVEYLKNYNFVWDLEKRNTQSAKLFPDDKN